MDSPSAPLRSMMSGAAVSNASRLIFPSPFALASLPPRAGPRRGYRSTFSHLALT